MSNQQIPIACDLNALPDREKHKQVTADLLPKTQSVTELDMGYMLQFPVDSLPLVATFINGERLCCPFVHFQIEIAPQATSVQLHLSGGEGVKAFLQVELLDNLPMMPL